MKKTLLFGGSGFFGPVILSKNPEIISVGRTLPPKECKNKHIQLNSLNEINKLDDVDFDKIIFLIGSSNHHEINLNTNMGIDLNVYPLNQALSYFAERKIKKFMCFTTILLYDQKKIILPGDLNEILNIPFRILEFKKKITFLTAKNQFKRNSLIHLRGYIIDKNERKIKKNNLELQLSEKEIDCLILFSQNKQPISRNIVLRKVWNYSPDSETHTVETHIHRLRKKILDKFNDNDFVKNNNKGYYI